MCQGYIAVCGAPATVILHGGQALAATGTRKPQHLGSTMLINGCLSPWHSAACVQGGGGREIRVSDGS